MAKNAYMAIYFVLMVAAIIGADVSSSGLLLGTAGREHCHRRRICCRLLLALEKLLSRAQPPSCVEEDCGSLPLRRQQDVRSGSRLAIEQFRCSFSLPFQSVFSGYSGASTKALA
jgi:hypothetical protein